MSKGKDPLEGKYFHTFTHPGESLEVQFQGVILSRVNPNMYLIQYFEWFCGTPTNERLVKVTDILNWNLYESSEEMIDWYERHQQKVAANG